MASIYRETVVDVGADRAWAALRTVAAPHELFAPVLTDGELNGETRRVQFANGMVLNERIIDIDDGMRRVAYSAIDAPGLVSPRLDAGAGRGLQPLPLRVDHGFSASRRRRRADPADRCRLGRAEDQPRSRKAGRQHGGYSAVSVMIGSMRAARRGMAWRWSDQCACATMKR